MALITDAQDIKKLRGTVIDALSKKVLVDVRVVSPEAAEMVQTDEKGHFILESSTLDKYFEVEMEGYYKQQVFINDEEEFQVVLIPTNLYGYTSTFQTPENVFNNSESVSSTFSIDKKDIRRSALFADEVLNGVVPGLMVSTKSGMPGEGNYISQMGIRSMVGKNTPLVIVDGMPLVNMEEESRSYYGYSSNILSSIMAKDVDKISFVKGFDAVPFGSMAGNGVLVIETDKAVDMETKVEFETVNGITYAKSKMPMMNSDEYNSFFMDMIKSKYTENQINEKFPFLTEDASGTYANNTYWMDEIFTPAFLTDNTLKVKGGDAIAKYTLTAGYMNQGGVVKNTNFSKYYTRVNANMSVNENLQMYVNAGFTYNEKELGEQGMHPQTNPLLAAMLKPAILSPWLRDDEGNVYPIHDPVREFGVSNPLAIVNDVISDAEGSDIIFNVGLSSKLTSDLSISGSVGMFYRSDVEEMFIPGVSSKAIAPLEEGFAKNTIRNTKFRVFDYYGNLQLTHNKVIGDHRIYSSLSGRFLSTEHTLETAKGVNTPTDFDNQLGSITTADGRVLGGIDDKYRWLNTSLSLRYSWANQLFAGVSAGIEANSIVGDDAPMVAAYPSFMLAWKLNNATFLRDASWCSDLTLRAEHTMSGNSRMPSMIGQETYTGYKYNNVVGLVRTNIPNSELKAERINTTTIGLDYANKSNRFSISADLFEQRVANMLVEDPQSSMYGSKYMYENEGEMQAQGFEIGLTVIPININDFRWTIGATISRSKTEIKSLGSRDSYITTLADGATLMTEVGGSPYAFYGYVDNGVITSMEESSDLGLQDYRGLAFGAGDMEFVDINSDNIINDQDQTVIGDATPDFFGGIFTSLQYKGFTLGAQFIYSYGNDIYNGVRRKGESMTDLSSQLKSVTNRWFYDGQQTSIPKATYGDPMGNARFSSRFIEDGSFLKLKHLTLNYNYPKNVLIFTGIQAYITAENLFTWSKYLGEEAEFAYSYDSKLLGVDYGKTPQGQTFKLGLRFNF